MLRSNARTILGSYRYDTVPGQVRRTLLKYQEPRTIGECSTRCQVTVSAVRCTMIPGSTGWPQSRIHDKIYALLRNQSNLKTPGGCTGYSPQNPLSLPPVSTSHPTRGYLLFRCPCARRVFNFNIFYGKSIAHYPLPVFNAPGKSKADKSAVGIFMVRSWAQTTLDASFGNNK